MLVLGFLWLLLLVVKLVWGLGPFLDRVGMVIWGIRLALAPRKLAFRRKNLITLVPLVLPALRLFRVLRVARAARELRLVKWSSW